MYMGISAHRQARPVGSYDDACRALEAATVTKSGKTRSPGTWGFPLGAHYKSVTHIREREGDIVFRLYDTDVVTWHPDNSFTIDSWASKTTAEFASRFTPPGVYLNASCVLRLQRGGDWGDRIICHADATVREVAPGIWAPDEDGLRPFRYPVLDQRMAREIRKEYPFADFDNWLSMAPMHLDLEHAGVDCEDVAKALKQRDFRTAAVHLPLVSETSAFGIKLRPLAIATPHGRAVTMSSLARFKDWLYDNEGALSWEETKVLTQREFDRYTKRITALAKAGIGTWRAGFG